MFSRPYSTNKQQWESSEFPVVCERCLGDNPYQRMMKQPFATECKMCARPFTVFRWKPSRKGGYACTTVCLTCAKTRNICQCCVLDLVYGMPAHLRDKIQPELDSGTPVPTSGAAREYYADLAERDLQNGNTKDFNKAPPKPKLVGIAAAAAPYMMTGGVGGKLIKLGGEDPNNTTIYFGGIQPLPSRDVINDIMAKFGEIGELRVIPQKCAFIQYKERSSAVLVMKSSRDINVEGKKVKIGWATTTKSSSGGNNSRKYSGKGRGGPPPGIKPPPGVAYPSMIGMEDGSQLK